MTEIDWTQVLVCPHGCPAWMTGIPGQASHLCRITGRWVQNRQPLDADEVARVLDRERP